jgi:hypothetical protein
MVLADNGSRKVKYGGTGLPHHSLPGKPWVLKYKYPGIQWKALLYAAVLIVKVEVKRIKGKQNKTSTFIRLFHFTHVKIKLRRCLLQ